MKTAFVLSGGASLGAIQAGMLRALYERGIAPDLIVGSSVGSINGAFIASRPPTVETAEGLADVWRGVSRGDIFPVNLLTGFVGFIGHRSDLVSEDGLREILDRNVEFARLERAPTPLHVIATDLFSGAERRLTEGDAVEAVLASAAIPGVFAPIEWGDSQLIDGGVSNNAPITHALELGAERIYVLPTGSTCALQEAPGGAIGMMLHAMSLLLTRRMLIEIQLLRDRANLIVLPPPCPQTVQPIDFGHADALVERGYEDGRAFLERTDEAHAPVPASLQAHDHRSA